MDKEILAPAVDEAGCFAEGGLAKFPKPGGRVEKAVEIVGDFKHAQASLVHYFFQIFQRTARVDFRQLQHLDGVVVDEITGGRLPSQPVKLLKWTGRQLEDDQPVVADIVQPGAYRRRVQVPLSVFEPVAD